MFIKKRKNVEVEIETMGMFKKIFLRFPLYYFSKNKLILGISPKYENHSKFTQSRDLLFTTPFPNCLFLKASQILLQTIQTMDLKLVIPPQNICTPLRSNNVRETNLNVVHVFHVNFEHIPYINLVSSPLT